MTATDSTTVIRRILVALDTSQQSRLALEAAARLAEWEEAELEGLYVEDINLIRLASFPVAREIGPTSLSPHPIDSGLLTRRLSSTATEARRWTAETAARRHLRWAFRIARGDVTSVILEAAGHADVVALGRAGAGTWGRGRLGSTARALASRPSPSVIVIQAPLTTGQTVVTLFDGSTACARALVTAAQLSERLEARLVVLVAVGDPTRKSQLLEGAMALVKGAHSHVVVRPVTGKDASIARAIQAENPTLCVVACEPESQDLVRRLTDDLRLSVFLVK